MNYEGEIAPKLLLSLVDPKRSFSFTKCVIYVITTFQCLYLTTEPKKNIDYWIRMKKKSEEMVVEKVSLLELVDLAIGAPEVGCLNLNLLLLPQVRGHDGGLCRPADGPGRPPSAPYRHHLQVDRR